MKNYFQTDQLSPILPGNWTTRVRGDVNPGDIQNSGLDQ